MKYYFCDFLEKGEYEGIYGRFTIDVTSMLQNSESTKLTKLVKTDTNKYILACEEEDIAGEFTDIIGGFSCKKIGSTIKNLSHTDENPIILIATKGFRVYENEDTYLKYLPVKGGVLVALIQGTIAVVNEDGSELSLSRNSGNLSNRKGVYYSAEDIAKFNTLKDDETGVSFSDICVNDVIMSVTLHRDGTSLKHLKYSTENFVILSDYIDYIKEKQRIIEEKRKQLAEERAKKALESIVKSKANEEYIEDEYIDEEEDYDYDSDSENFGASSFLASVKNL